MRPGDSAIKETIVSSHTPIEKRETTQTQFQIELKIYTANQIEYQTQYLTQ